MIASNHEVHNAYPEMPEPPFQVPLATSVQYSDLATARCRALKDAIKVPHICTILPPRLVIVATALGIAAQST
jgi:hypothetical protein